MNRLFWVCELCFAIGLLIAISMIVSFPLAMIMAFVFGAVLGGFTLHKKIVEDKK